MTVAVRLLDARNLDINVSMPKYLREVRNELTATHSVATQSPVQKMSCVWFKEIILTISRNPLVRRPCKDLEKPH